MLLRYSKDTLLRVIGITLAAMVFLLYLLFHDGYHRDEGLEMSALDTAHASERHHPPTAYATFLTATDANSDDDFYLGLVRLLLFSIKYDPETRDDKGRDFIVITTDLVAREHEELLEREGAIVRHVELLDWAFEGADTPLIERWRHQETKLQIFAQDDYEVIMYMDADHIMLRPWTTLWEEFEAMPVAPLTAHHDSYWQGLMGMDEKEVVLFNGGFLIVRPDRRIFEELLKVTGFIKGYHDQAILNKYFANEGDHPWQKIPYRKYFWFGADEAEVKELTAVHTKFWEDYQPDHIKKVYYRRKGRMEGYWLGREKVEERT